MKKVQILVVEDEGITLEYIKNTLSNLGYKVVGDADNGRDAITKAENLKPDLVLMDIHLKGKMDGIEAAAQIQQKYDVPVIYLTAYSDNETLQRAKITNPYGYLLKPPQILELKIAIEIVLYKHQIEKKLTESEKKYRSIFENSLDSIFVLDRDGNFLDINDAGFDFFGYPENELTSFFSEHLYKNPREKKSIIKQLKNEGFVKDLELNLLRKDGSHIIGLLSAVTIKKGNGKISGFQGIIKDITREKIMEVQLLQALKMESIGRFAAGISHDFNNLLTIINGYADVLLMKTAEKKIRNDLKIISSAGEKAAQLVNQIMAFSRKQLINPIDLNINEIIMELQKMVERIIHNNITLDISLAPHIRSIKMDSSQLEQVVMNLIINARDAMSKGGTLTLETKNTYIDHDLITSYPFLKTGYFVELIISDTGVGMDQATVEKIFEPFFTTKSAGEGTGLGLATVYAIIKQNNGYILVSSKPQQGTIFHVYLPVYKAQKTTPALERTVEAVSFPPFSILIVESEWGLRKLLEDIFQSLGFNTLKAESSKEAVKVAKLYSGNLDFMYTEVMMPGLTVSEMVERVTALHPDIKVIYSSGYPRDIIEKMGLELNFIHFLKKPFPKNVLIEMLKNMIQENSHEQSKNPAG